ncbi:transposase [Nonomuraea mesophila]|uniref:Transposase n=1 Tax=Nonomuraea mesophila TaxID=2530382 RepID=A0A4R5FVN0_9ACTN|nr:transposase [Nonomuraea mesophila]
MPISRKVIWWEIWPTENGALAKEFIERAIEGNGGIAPDAIHADRGTSMTSNTVTGLLAQLGIDQSYSRPRVSNDNPYSEAQFKTLKYCPAFPGRFGSIEDTRIFCEQFFDYYNNEHRHSGIAMHTPASVHDGTAVKIHAQRIATLNAALLARPERFRGQRPTRRRCLRMLLSPRDQADHNPFEAQPIRHARPVASEGRGGWGALGMKPGPTRRPVDGHPPNVCRSA